MPCIGADRLSKGKPAPTIRVYMCTSSLHTPALMATPVPKGKPWPHVILSMASKDMRKEYTVKDIICDMQAASTLVWDVTVNQFQG